MHRANIRYLRYKRGTLEHMHCFLDCINNEINDRAVKQWYAWHLHWKSTLVSMGQIVRCAYGVTNFTLTLKTSSSHLFNISPSINSQEVNTVNCKTQFSFLYMATVPKVSRPTVTWFKSAET